MEETDGDVYLVSDVNLRELINFKGNKIDSERLGVTKLSGLPFENPDGTSFTLDKDYFGVSRSSITVVGPFESLSSTTRIKVWPL